MLQDRLFGIIIGQNLLQGQWPECLEKIMEAEDSEQSKGFWMKGLSQCFACPKEFDEA